MPALARLLPVTAALIAPLLLATAIALAPTPARALGEGWMEAYEWKEDWPLRSLEGWTYVVAGRKEKGDNTGTIVRAAECGKDRCTIPKPADAVEPIFRLTWNSKVAMVPDAPPQLWGWLAIARPGSEGVSPLLGGELTFWAAGETAMPTEEDETLNLDLFKAMLTDNGSYWRVRVEEPTAEGLLTHGIEFVEFLIPTERFEEAGGLNSLDESTLEPLFDHHRARLKE